MFTSFRSQLIQPKYSVQLKMLFTMLVLAILAVLSTSYYFQTAFTYWSNRQIPSILPEFPWGNCKTLLIRREHFGQILTNSYNRMKTHRFFGFYISTYPALIIRDPALLRLVLTKDFHVFPNKNLYSNEKKEPLTAHLLSLNGPKWRKLRTKLTPIFSSGKIKAMFEVFKQCTGLLEATLDASNGQPVNTKHLFSIFSSEVIANCAFGLDMDAVTTSRREFQAQAESVLQMGWKQSLTWVVGPAFPRLFRYLGFRLLHKDTSEYFMNIVRTTVERRTASGTVRNDFLQLLMEINTKVSDEEKFTMEELAAQCFIFLVAGYDTSATTMTFAMYEICRNPEIYARLVREIEDVAGKYNNEISYDAINEMTYLSGVVQETLRKHPPAYHVTRTSVDEYELGDTGLVIEKNTKVIVPVRGLHYDAQYFPEPEKFDPERFSHENRARIVPFTYLPFGEGPRNCIGRRFGILEVKLALIFVLRKYRFSLDAKKTEIPLELDPSSFLLNAKNGIWLRCEKI